MSDFHIPPNPDTRPITSTPGTPVEPAMDLSSAPDAPDDGPEFPPGTVPATEDPAQPPQLAAVPDGSPGETFKLPDGREVSIQDIQRWAEQEAATSPEAQQAPPAEPPAWLDSLLKRLDRAEGRTTQQGAEQGQGAQEAAQAPGQRTISPVKEPSVWMQGYRNLYVRQTGQEPTPAVLQEALRDAKLHVLAEQNERMQTQLQEYHGNTQLQQQRSVLQKEVDTLTAQFPRLQSPSGLKIRDMALAQAAATGQKDLKKVFQEANNLAVSWVMESYGTPKKQQLRAVQPGMPRGGGPRAATKQDHGNDFGAISRMAEARARNGG